MSRIQTGSGTLSINAKGNSPANCSPLTIMARQVNYEVQVTAAPRGGCGACLGLFYNVQNWLFAEIKDNEVRVLGADGVLGTRAWHKPYAHLRIINSGEHVTFLVSETGHDWQTLIADLDVSGYQHNHLKGFQCLRPALY